jgi:uncharacterized protein YdaU (DUF1376 family)
MEPQLMAALPYMRMYWADYDADTSHLSTMQHGIYLLLIKNYWQRSGPLPDDELRLSRIAKVSLKDWRRNEGVIREFFSVRESLWHHNRIALELSRVAAKSLKAKEAALANAKRTQSKRSSSAERTPAYTEAEADTVPEANASGDIQAFDAETVMWRHGKLYLQSQGVRADKAGSLLGKWKKDHGAEAVIVALGKSQREGAIDPVSFITGCLDSRRKGGGYDPERITV